jgi:hypothetical protein
MTNLTPPAHRRRSYSYGSVFALALAAGGMACGASTPITPEALPQTQSSRSVGGKIFEHTMSGVRPIGGVPVRVFPSVPHEPTHFVDVTSGADGSFSAAVRDSMYFVTAQVAPGSTYFTPCPPFAWNQQATRVELDVHVVSGAVLSTAGMPPSYPTESPPGGFRALISGRVAERTARGPEPVAGATVVMSGAQPLVVPTPGATVPVHEGDAVADTLTDANGRYLLCSVGNPEVAVFVSARKAGYVTASAYNLPWFGWDLDFELTRR